MNKTCPEGVKLRPFVIKLDKFNVNQITNTSDQEMVPKRNCDCLKDLASHPAIREIEKKLNRILELLEGEQILDTPDFSAAAKYFPGKR
jgi:hypothetical protein